MNVFYRQVLFAQKIKTIWQMQESSIMTVNGYGDQVWCQNGKRHRDNDLPAVIRVNGTQVWCQHGVMHRENDLPAYIGAHGTLEWYQNGVIHRDPKGDLPARIWADGTQEWYQMGVLHRNGDLPARIRADGTYAWYHNGVLLNNEQVWEQIYARILHENTRKIVLMYVLGVPRDVGMEICKYSCI